MYIFTTPRKVSSHHIGDIRNTLFSPVGKVATLFFYEQSIIGVSFITDFWTSRLNEIERQLRAFRGRQALDAKPGDGLAGRSTWMFMTAKKALPGSHSSRKNK